ncbi:MAG: hypothetical protein V4623_07030 [Pseudomonadota bacterium]
MLEQKLIVNRLINLSLINKPVLPYTHGSFVTVATQNYHLCESTGFHTKSSLIQAGTHPKSHRNFRWLPWLPGAISETTLQEMDVLTGPMSGCWLVKYRNPNGVLCVGHLGTDIANPLSTQAVNNTWNNFARSNPSAVVGGFNPLRHWEGEFPVRRSNEPATHPKIFGLFTTSNTYYVVVAYPQVNPITMLRIAGVQQVKSSLMSRLQHIDLPGV